MGRKASHCLSKPHPPPNFRDTVRLLSCVCGEADADVKGKRQNFRTNANRITTLVGKPPLMPITY